MIIDLVVVHYIFVYLILILIYCNVMQDSRIKLLVCNS